MKITIVCTSINHPVNAYLERWIGAQELKHQIDLVRSKRELTGGDLLFLISCSELVSKEERDRYDKTLLVHASDLPRGRGWSPHIWQILEGATRICVTLLEAEDKVDSGSIWSQIWVDIPPHALWNEINHAIFEAELELMDFAVTNFGVVRPRAQSAEVAPTYYPRRNEADSALDPAKSIEEQFDLMRVSDPARFPAYFELRGQRYILKLEKA